MTDSAASPDRSSSQAAGDPAPSSSQTSDAAQTEETYQPPRLEPLGTLPRSTGMPVSAQTFPETPQP